LLLHSRAAVPVPQLLCPAIAAAAGATAQPDSATRPHLASVPLQSTTVATVPAATTTIASRPATATATEAAATVTSTAAAATTTAT
jgi:hypothetical protein